MTSLFIWVLAVLVVPNLSPYAASFFRPTPSSTKVNREVFRLTQDERDVLGRRLSGEKTAAVLKEQPVLAGVERTSEKEIKDRIAKDPLFAKAYDIYRKAGQEGWDEANAVQNAKAHVLTDDLDRKEKAQTRLAVLLSMASPLADFTFLATDLSNTGMRNQRQFQALSGGWNQAYSAYSDRRMGELKKANPTADVWNIAADVHDMPRFAYKEEDLAARMKGILAAFAVLAGMALAAFWAAYFSFRGYDAR